MKIGDKEFSVGERTYVMGILNCTPDSFSDGGKYNTIEKALLQTEKMIREGADIIDVGGESTRPGAQFVSETEETERVIPVIEAIHSRFEITVSVDTYKSVVAREAIRAGAVLVNDIWGCKKDDRMAEVIAESKAACCLMHNRDVERHPYRQELMTEIKQDLKESISLALAAGVEKDRIMIDPGIGFAKTREENLYVLHHLEELKELGYPVLLGTSRKSVIGLTLKVDKDNRLPGTIATSVIGVMKGCSFIRVHDVAENRQAVLMTQAIFDAD